MNLQERAGIILPALEVELKRQVTRLDRPDSRVFHDMLSYHMGWVSYGDVPAAAGKRIRPLLTLLVVESCGEEWLRAVPAASAVELVHNFSLIHDDIEDDSKTRRGRPTLWQKHGVPMAINAGDAMFAIANQAVMDAVAHYPADMVVRAARSLHNACLSLTRGQFLDMSYENRQDLTVDDYWPMVEGKTAALVSAAAEMGAILGGAQKETVERFAEFGRNLGLAFQVQDDILGIWGDETETGKSKASDLVEGKNSLPVLFGIAQKGEFARRWAAAGIEVEETQALAKLLRSEGAYAYCLEQAELLTTAALYSLKIAAPGSHAAEPLTELALQLLQRRS